MNRKEFTEYLAKQNGWNRSEAEYYLMAVLMGIESVLAEGETVQLTGFGTFETKQRKARQGRNPHNPEETFEVPEKSAPVFRAGKNLKRAVE